MGFIKIQLFVNKITCHCLKNRNTQKICMFSSAAIDSVCLKQDYLKDLKFKLRISTICAYEIYLFFIS